MSKVTYTVVLVDDVRNKIRGGSVEVGLNHDVTAESAFVNSQNDFNPLPNKRSSQVGDIIVLHFRQGRLNYLVMPFGFKQIDDAQKEQYYKLDEMGRWRVTRLNKGEVFEEVFEQQVSATA